MIPWNVSAQKTPVPPNDSDKASYYNGIASNSGNIDSVIHFATLSLKYCNQTDYSLIASNYFCINDWRNDRPIIDDMTLIGIRV